VGAVIAASPQHVLHRVFFSYVLPCVLVGVVWMLMFVLQQIGTTTEQYFFLFVPSVILSAWYGGQTGGVIASVLAVLIMARTYGEPIGPLRIGDWREALILGLFAGVCTSIGVLTATFRRADADRQRALREAEAARREADVSSRLKDQFLATLSHELRTPLNAVLGWARLLSNGQVDPDRVPAALASIERNAHAQKQLVDDLLDISAIVSGRLPLRPREFDLADLARDAVDAVRLSLDARHHRLEQQIDPVPMRGDADRLRQVLWNLLSNAVKFTPDGGQIHLRIFRDEGQAYMVVRDSGRGIAPEFLPFVFEPFRQADSSITRTSGGLGLGLALVRHLVEAHGGSVRVDSGGLRLGATFTVALPLHGPPASTDPSEPPPASADTDASAAHAAAGAGTRHP